MTQNANPYEPSATTLQETAARQSTAIGKPMAALVGVFTCAFIAVVAGELLSVIALLPPMNHGFALGLLYPRPWSHR